MLGAMIGYRATDRQIKWAGRLTPVLRAVLVVYVLGWVYNVGHTWLVLSLSREALKSFAIGIAVVGALFLADRRLGDFRRR